MERTSQSLLIVALLFALLALLRSRGHPRFSTIALLGASLYSCPFVAGSYSLVTRYKEGNPIIKEVDFTPEARLIWTSILGILIINSLTDKSDVQPPSSAALRSSQLLLSTLYVAALLATSRLILQNISVEKNERISSFGVMFSIQQLLGTMVVVLALGVFAKRFSIIQLAALIAILVDLILGYRVVTVLGLLGGMVLRASTRGKVTKALIPLLLISIGVGLILKPIYYRLESSRPLSVGEIDVYVAEGLETYEGNVIAAVFQTTINAPELLQLPPLTALVPSVLPLGGSIFGEPKGFSETFSATFYPGTPWGFGGSLLGESVARGGNAAIIAAILLIVVLSRIRLRSDVGRLILFYSAPFVFFYSFRADLSYTLDALSKIACLGAAVVLIARHPLVQRKLGPPRAIRASNTK